MVKCNVALGLSGTSPAMFWRFGMLTLVHGKAVSAVYMTRISQQEAFVVGRQGLREAFNVFIHAMSCISILFCPK